MIKYPVWINRPYIDKNNLAADDRIVLHIEAPSLFDARLQAQKTMRKRFNMELDKDYTWVDTEYCTCGNRLSEGDEELGFMCKDCR